MSDDDQKPRVFQLGTVPPPAGENDAYNAPTKVGPMAAQIQELINAATEEAERKSAQAQPATTAPPPLAATTAPPPLTTTDEPSDDAAAAPDFPEEDEEEAPLSSNVPDEHEDTRIADGAYAMLADVPTGPRATPPRPASAQAAPRPASATPPPVSAAPPPMPVAPSAPPPLVSAAAPPPASAPPPPPVEAAAFPVGPAPIVITEPLPAFDDVKPEPAPLATESNPASYSDPIAHTRPEWSSVSKSEPKIPVAARAPNRTPLIIGILVVVFGIAGVAFLIFGHR